MSDRSSGSGSESDDGGSGDDGSDSGSGSGSRTSMSGEEEEDDDKFFDLQEEDERVKSAPPISAAAEVDLIHELSRRMSDVRSRLQLRYPQSMVPKEAAVETPTPPAPPRYVYPTIDPYSHTPSVEPRSGPLLPPNVIDALDLLCRPGEGGAGVGEGPAVSDEEVDWQDRGWV